MATTSVNSSPSVSADVSEQFCVTLWCETWLTAELCYWVWFVYGRGLNKLVPPFDHYCTHSDSKLCHQHSYLGYCGIWHWEEVKTHFCCYVITFRGSEAAAAIFIWVSGVGLRKHLSKHKVYLNQTSVWGVLNRPGMSTLQRLHFSFN